MTYGWAILVVIIAVSGLAYYNFFSASKYFPEECELSPKIICKNWKISTNTITLIIRNEYGETINPFNITVLSNQGCNTAFAAATNGLSDGEEEKITLNCAQLITNENYEANLNMSYKGTAGTTHSTIGKLRGKRE